jgi:hypothetical protein
MVGHVEEYSKQADVGGEGHCVLGGPRRDTGLLMLGVATAAFGANGGNFILGKTNVATLITKLGGQQGVNGAMFEVQNNNSGTDDTALSLKV